MFGIGSSKKKKEKEEIAEAEWKAKREAYYKKEQEARAEEKERLKGYLRGLDDKELRLALALVHLEHSARIRSGDYRIDYLNEECVEELLKERESKKSEDAQTE